MYVELCTFITEITLILVLLTEWNTNQRRIAAPRDPTARSTKPSLFMSIVPWILRPKYSRPGARSAAAILWETDRGGDLSKQQQQQQQQIKAVIGLVMCAVKHIVSSFKTCRFKRIYSRIIRKQTRKIVFLEIEFLSGTVSSSQWLMTKRQTRV